MAHTIKNLSGFPLDVPTMNGPALLPAYGEITAELGAYDAEALRLGGYVEITDVHPLDHDADGRKGGSKPRKNVKG